MQISPTVASVVTGTLSVLSFIGAMSPKMFPSYIPSIEAQDIITTAGLASGLLMAAVTPLHLFSSSQPGPLAAPSVAPSAPTQTLAQK